MREFMAMAASRRLLLTSTLFRIHQNTTPFLISKSLIRRTISNLPCTHLLKTPHLSRTLTPFSNPNLFINRPSSSYTTTTSTASIDESKAVCSHPWPEWVEFLGKLKKLGFIKNENEEEDEEESDGDGVRRYSKKELYTWNHACLDFARERFDIFKSLSTEHIQAVVECGCPNLDRKPVNSAKRLRATLGIDEGDVCSACKLREDCDRAYGILKDNEATARTVDIMRMLLFYALDPLVLYGGEKPDGRERIEVSARKLLSELSDLSETIPDPSLPKPAVNPPRQMKEKTMGSESQNVEMKRGDWICTKCNFMNFARNLRCLECKTEGPQRINVGDVEMKKGDWNCTQCQFMNFARNTECMRCRNARPKRELLPGEWECPSCDFLNYRRNTVCLKCNCDRPRDKVSEYEEQIWRQPQQRHR
ncbi:hypothetical protein ACHQM5_005431 [Ranunculus cassubicifolius]